MAAAVGLLLAAGLEAVFPWKEDSSAASRYVIAGGVGFGVGAGYALLRCTSAGSSQS